MIDQAIRPSDLAGEVSRRSESWKWRRKMAGAITPLYFMAAEQYVKGMQMLSRLQGPVAGAGTFNRMAIARARKRGQKLRMRTGAPWKDGPQRKGVA